MSTSDPVSTASSISLTKSSGHVVAVRLWIKSNWKTILEATILSCVVFVVLSLYALPTVFYALPVESTTLLNEQNVNEDHDIKPSVNHSTDLCAPQKLNTDVREECLNTSERQVLPGDQFIVCDEGFYIENVSSPLCIPSCGYWLSISRNLANTIVDTTGVIVSIVSSIILFVLAFWLQRDTILVYPTIYLIYIGLTLFILSPVVLVANLWKEAVLCSSDNLLESFVNETTFCTITGVVHDYALMQISLWILLHAIGIFRSIFFPFSYERIKAAGKQKYIIWSTDVAGLILPLTPSMLHLIDGYSITPSTVDICVGRNAAISYFTLVLPFSILFALTTILLIAIFWKILKVFFIKHKTNGQPQKVIRKAEARILLIMFYYIIVGVITMTGYTSFITSGDHISDLFYDYISCQSVGIQPHIDCGQPPEFIFRELVSFSVVLLSLLPTVILIFTAKCTCTKKCVRRGNVPVT